MIGGQRGRKEGWKSPFEWTDGEVKNLVVKEVGHDILFPVGFRVLLKLWVAPEKDGSVYIPETIRNNEVGVTGMVLGMGGDAFRNPNIFPSGPWCSYGDWVIFRPYEDQKVKIYRQHVLTYITDERIMSLADGDHIEHIQSTLKLEETYKELGG
jgi:hypothetical protein